MSARGVSFDRIDAMRFVAFSALLTVASASLWGQAAAPKAAPAKGRTGYLTAAAMPDVAQIVPPPPAAGSARGARDREVYRATRSLKDTPRWALALSDNDISTAGVMKAFSCSLGVGLTPASAPRLAALFGKAAVDLTAGFNTLKNLHGTQRPFQIEPGPICLPSTASIAGSSDFPSGHATFGWAMGLMLAELVPDAATAVLTRARSFGESRAVCGVHNVSAVEGGVATGTVVLAAQHSSAAFRADMDAARVELANLRAAASGAPESCTLENQALAKNPY